MAIDTITIQKRIKNTGFIAVHVLTCGALQLLPKHLPNPILFHQQPKSNQNIDY